MSSQSNEARLSLNRISRYILTEQNIDIGLLTSGHLNERHLWKPHEMRTHQPWDTSRSVRDKPNQHVPKLKLRASLKKDEDEVDAEFKEKYTKLKLITLNNKVLKASSLSSISKKPDDAENQKTNEIKLPHIDLSSLKQSPRNPDEIYGITDKELALKILSGPFKGITKEENFRNRVKYEKEVLKKDDLLINNVMHSSDSAAYLESKLIQELEKYKLVNVSKATVNSNLVKLNVYSNIFEELIEESSFFGEILNRIKNEYDDYLFFLLRTPEIDDRLLYNQMQVTQEYRDSNQLKIKKLDEELEELENAIVAINQSNLNLKNRMNEETNFYNEKSEKKAELDRYFSMKRLMDKDFDKPSKKITIGDRIEAAKELVLAKLNELKTINDKLKKDFVPSVVIENLTKIIKDIDIEILKTEEQNKYLITQEKEVEKELRSLLLENDKTEFAEENVENLIKFIKNFDVLAMSGESADDINIIHRYDDYFS